MSNNIDFSKYNIKPTSFNLVNSDKRLSDNELKTKPTSFAKDSFRRFCKNKSSIVGAIVLGILILLSLLVPLFSPHSTERVSVDDQFLRPKLFKSGTGFWDGTVKYEKKVMIDGSISGILYDFANDTPAGFYKPAVTNLVIDSEPSYANSKSKYGVGGYVMFITPKANASNGKSSYILNTNDAFDIIAADNYRLKVAMGNTDGVENRTLGEYRVYLSNGTKEVVLKDWSTEYSDFELSISDALTAQSIATLEKAKLYFELKAVEDVENYILIKNCLLSCDNVEAQVDLDLLGFTDANKMVSIEKDPGGTEFPKGYWSCNGVKSVYAVEVHYCTFTYDTYEKAYGVREVQYALSEMNKFKNEGKCDFDPRDIENTYRPIGDFIIKEVYGAQYNAVTGKVLSVKAEVPNWYKLGYKSEPRYLFGTDSSGIDVFTRMFTGLRTSLLLGVCTAAFCFVFGLIWGSISGYFGGVIDLAMERFCDILGGVPWIVVMTLAILHFGNNFLTFFLALCLTGWMGTAARTRTQFYRFKGGEYVLASRTLGASDARLIFRHILPNSLGTIITSSVLMIVSTIYSESTLAYLNLGLKGTQAFGVMLAENQSYIQSQSYLVVFPAIVMALLMISFNLFGNGLRDALNPSLRGAEE